MSQNSFSTIDEPFGEDMLIPIKAGLAVRAPVARRTLVDVDFSLALHNRTGKYFIGRELLAMDDIPLGDVYYWRRKAKSVPSGLRAKILGRLQHWDVDHRTRGGWGVGYPARTSQRPLLHLDPFTVPTVKLRRADAVLIHDMGPLTHPELFPADVARMYGPIYDEIARVGPNLVFVSKTVQTEFSVRFPYARPAATSIVHPPVRDDVLTGESTPVAGIKGPFLLTVGSIGHRKNQARVISAYARSCLAKAGVGYVIVGGPEPGHAEVMAAAEKTPGVHALPYVSDAELRWLYERASGFVLLSLLEGFGMPIVEAIRRGLVPLVSRGGVLEEVGGSAALTADPMDEEDIAHAMLELASITDEERARRMNILTPSMERFDITHFQRGWRQVMFNMLATA